MKKQKLMTLAMIGISTGMLLTGCEKDTKRDNRPGGNTAAAEQTNPVAINQSCGGVSGCGGIHTQGQPYTGYDQTQGQNQGQKYIQPQNPQGGAYQGQSYQQGQPYQGQSYQQGQSHQ